MRILECEITINTIEDRKNCFDISTPTKEVYTFQADSDFEMKAWLDVFEYVKMTEHISADAMQPFEKKLSDSTIESETKLDVKMEESSAIETEPKINGVVSYIDQELSKSDIEFHQLVKSIPPSDCILDNFAAGWKVDKLIQGRCYVTANRLCFYSNILGLVNIVVVNYKDITEISQSGSGLQTDIGISTNAGKIYAFKIYSKSETSHDFLTMAWKNYSSDQPMNAQALHDNLSGFFREASLSPGKTVDQMTTSSFPNLLSTVDEVLPHNNKWKLPPGLQPPAEDVKCDCKEHLDKIESVLVLQASAKEVCELLFGSMSENFWNHLEKQRGITNRKVTPWSDELLPSRQIEYVMPLSNPLVKLKEVEVKETNIFLKNDNYFCYVVEIRSSILQIPFGDCFLTCSRYCITWITESTCQVQISIGMNFTKNTLMKSIIKSNGIRGIADSVVGINAHLLASLRKPEAISKPLSETLPGNDAWNLPGDLNIPAGEISCGCTNHLEKTSIDAVLPFTAKQAFELLFGDASKAFWDSLDKKRGITDRVETPWSEDQSPLKKFTFNMPMNNPLVKLKVVEVQGNVLIMKREEYFSYVVELQSLTPQVPYGDCFTTETRYCISWVSKSSCRLLISNGMTFIKSTMMKSIIKSNGLKGMIDASVELHAFLLESNKSADQNITSEAANSPPATAPNAARTSVIKDKNSNYSQYVAQLFSFFAGILVCFLVMKYLMVSDIPIANSQKTYSNGIPAFANPKPSYKYRKLT